MTVLLNQPFHSVPFVLLLYHTHMLKIDVYFHQEACKHSHYYIVIVAYVIKEHSISCFAFEKPQIVIAIKSLK